MNRCCTWTLAASLILVGMIRADEPPALPKDFSADAGWTYMKVVGDADGKPLLKRFWYESRTVTEMKTVTKLVKETRVVDGETITLEIPKVEVAPVNVEVWTWKASVAALEDPRLQFFDMKGEPIAAEAVRDRLAKTTVVKWGGARKPDPYYLQSAKADTILVVAPGEAFAALPGISKEPLPNKGSYAEFAYAKCTVSAGRRVVEILQLNAKSSKATDFKAVAYWDHAEAPLDHPELKVTTQQGKKIDTADVIARFKEWTPILFTPFEPHPIWLASANPDLLLVSPPLSSLRMTVREYGQPLPQVADNNPPKTTPKIDRLPMPPLLPLPPLPIDPKPQPVDPKPTPIDPMPKVPAGDAVPEGGPPIAVVKKTLEVQWGPLGRFTKHQYEFKSIRFGPPMKEVVTVNGQGQFTGKVRYPVRVLCDINVLFNDGTSRMETKHQTFHFFLDPFNEWSFRFIENN